MANISSLTVSLGINSAALIKGLKKSRRSMKRWAKNAIRNVKSVVKSFSLLGAISFAGFILTINKSREAIDKLAKNSAKIGIPIERLQQLRFAAEQSGLGVDAFDNSMQRMVKRVGKAASGLGLAKTAIEQLGLDAEKLGELSPDEMFTELKNAILKVNNVAQQTQLSDAIFGPGFLNVVRANIDGLSKEYDALGIGITANQAKAVEAFSDSKNKIDKIFSGFANNLTAELSPLFTFVNNEIQALIKNGGGVKQFAIDFANSIIDGVVKAIDGFRELVQMFRNFKLFIINTDIAATNFMNTLRSFSPGYWLDIKRNVKEHMAAIDKLTKEKLLLEIDLSTSSDLQKDVDDFAARMQKTIGSGATPDGGITADMPHAEQIKLAMHKGSAMKSEEIAKKQLTEQIKTSTAVRELVDVSKVKKAEGEKIADFTSSRKPFFEASGIATAGPFKEGINSFSSATHPGAREGAAKELKRIADLQLVEQRKTASAVSRLAEQSAEKPQSLGQLTINMITDTGKIAGEIFGEPVFLRNLKSFVDRQTNNATRQAAGG